MLRNLILCAILISGLSALAESPAYQIPTTRNGVKGTSLAYNFWSGEYPGPVADVTEALTVDAYMSVRVLDQVQACTLKEGLYHPWSETQNSVINYYTVSDIFTYKATQDVKGIEIYLGHQAFEDISIFKGDVITNVFYFSEGYCGGAVRRLNGKVIDIEFTCDDVLANKSFEHTGANMYHPKVYEQWMYVQCEEGHKAFIRDAALMSLPKVMQGEITGYGSVGPAQ